MITCYVMSLVTLITLLIGFAQSFLHFHVYEANHVTFMILTSIIYLFTESLVIFFFVGTGVSIRDYTKDHQLDNSFHKRSIAIKRRVYPPLLLNMLFMIILFIMVGAVETYRMPGIIYYIIFAGCIFHFLKIKIVQHHCFRDNTSIILEMSGVKHPLTQ